MWTKRCAWVQSRLPLMAGDELFGLDRRRVERHLIGCAHCQGRLVALQETLDVLQFAAAQPLLGREMPPLWPAVARQIRETRRPAAPWLASLPRVAIWSAACLVAGMLTSAWLMKPPRPSPGAPVVAGTVPAASGARPVSQTVSPSPRIASLAAKPLKPKAESVAKESSALAENSTAQRSTSAEAERSSSPSSDTRDTH